MNKLFILLFFLVLGLNPSFAQIDVGLKFGLNVSNVSSSNKEDFSSFLNFNSGVVVRFKMADKFLLNAEILSSNKGFNSVLSPGGSTSNQLTYLSFPVLLQYCATKKIYFQLGPELNFLTKAKMKNSTVDSMVTKDYNTFDFSIAGGVGVTIFKVLNLETRYSLGLSQIKKEENTYGSYKNRTFQISLIYFLISKE